MVSKSIPKKAPTVGTMLIWYNVKKWIILYVGKSASTIGSQKYMMVLIDWELQSNIWFYLALRQKKTLKKIISISHLCSR
jgi:hypothetical protein